MNYKQEYEYIYNSYYSRIEKLIKDYFIAAKVKKRKIEAVDNTLHSRLWSTRSRFKIVKFSRLESLLKSFDKRFYYYEEDHLNLIFSNEIKIDYDAIPTDLLPPNYTFEKLLKEIAIITAIDDIKNFLDINRKLFYLFYSSNDFSTFEIKGYRGLAVEDTPIFIDLNKKVNPDFYDNPIDSDFSVEETEEDAKKPFSLPFAIALLNEIGFFELEKIKKLSPIDLAKIIAIIQLKDSNNKTTNRAISGNIRVLNPDNKEDALKYTSHKHAEKVKILLNEIKQGE